MHLDSANIILLDPYEPEAENLLGASDRYLGTLYPPESNHLERQDGLSKANVLFLGYRLDGQVVGCGAVKTLSDASGRYGEIKRLFIYDAFRGKGIGALIIRALEMHLESEGVLICRLETGVKQPEALGLYNRLGYIVREHFGDYEPDPLSIFMEKKLDV